MLLWSPEGSGLCAVAAVGFPAFCGIPSVGGITGGVVRGDFVTGRRLPDRRAKDGLASFHSPLPFAILQILYIPVQPSVPSVFQHLTLCGG